MSRTALLLGVALIGSTATPTVSIGDAAIGFGRAEAATGYYTRKKVRGRWITGKFPREQAGRRAARIAPPIVAASAQPARPATPAETAPAIPASAPSSQPEASTGSIAIPLPAEAGPPRVSSLPPPDRVIATASIGSLQPTPGLERMRSALEQRARSIRAAEEPVAVPLPEAAPPVRMVAKSVTFDLARGERTIVFDTGESVTAPFDRDRASDLTGFRSAAPR